MDQSLIDKVEFKAVKRRRVPSKSPTTDPIADMSPLRVRVIRAFCSIFLAGLIMYALQEAIIQILSFMFNQHLSWPGFLQMLTNQMRG